MTGKEASAISSFIHEMNLPPSPTYWVGGGDGTLCNVITTWKDGGYNSDVFLAGLKKKCFDSIEKTLCKRLLGKCLIFFMISYFWYLTYMFLETVYYKLV